jgi:hypothetical protein
MLIVLHAFLLVSRFHTERCISDHLGIALISNMNLCSVRYPFFTVLFQSLAGLVVGIEALHTFVPFYVIDSVGCSFALAMIKLLNPACVTLAYVHYPTMSERGK